MKKLVISPHIDDEVLGCGGILDKDTFVVYCGFDETHIKGEWVRERPDTNTRLKELLNCSFEEIKLLETVRLTCWYILLAQSLYAQI